MRFHDLLHFLTNARPLLNLNERLCIDHYGFMDNFR